MNVATRSWASVIAGTLLGTWLATPIKADLILHWNFDEESGAVVDHGVSPAADGTLFGQAARTTNTPGPGSIRAIDLVGANNADNNYVFADYPAKLNAGFGQMTVTFWMNVQAAPANLDRIASMWSTGPNAGWEIRTLTPNAGSISADNFALGLTINGLGSRSPDIVDRGDEWVFFAVTYDSALTDTNTQFYLGTSGDQTSLLGTWTPSQHPTPAAAAAGTEFPVGSAFASSSDRTPPAWLDDVRVYDEVLAQAQLEQIRLAVAVPEPTSLILAMTALTGLGLFQWKRLRVVSPINGG